MINAKDSKDTFYLLNKKQKTPIILIHGVGLNHTIWEPQIDYFDNTVLAYDILGHGKTPLNKNIISFDDFSDQLLNLIDELKFEKIHLIGFSIGSLIARNFAVKNNNRLKTLTLLCSVFKRNKEQQQIVNDRFELSKKSRSLSRQALKRWFTDQYLEKNPNIFEKITSILIQNNMENFLKIYEFNRNQLSGSRNSRKITEAHKKRSSITESQAFWMKFGQQPSDSGMSRGSRNNFRHPVSKNTVLEWLLFFSPF